VTAKPGVRNGGASRGKNSRRRHRRHPSLRGARRAELLRGDKGTVVSGDESWRDQPHEESMWGRRRTQNDRTWQTRLPRRGLRRDLAVVTAKKRRRCETAKERKTENEAKAKRRRAQTGCATTISRRVGVSARRATKPVTCRGAQEQGPRLERGRCRRKTAARRRASDATKVHVPSQAVRPAPTRGW